MESHIDYWRNTKILHLSVFSTCILYKQGVACDPLHGLEKEAGQRHSFTAVVGGNLLLKKRQTVREVKIYMLLHLTDPDLFCPACFILLSSTTHTLRKSLKSGWLWVFSCSRAAALSWQEQKRM